MFFKTRKKITETERLEAILEYLKKEQTRWTLSRQSAHRPEAINKFDARLMYLEEQIALTSAYLAVESINPNK